MTRFILNLFATGGLFYIFTVSGWGIGVDSFWTALEAALVLSILNFFVKPLLALLTLPLTLMTLGISYLFLNTAILYLAAWVVTGFHIYHFGAAFVLGIVLTLVNRIFS